MTTSTNVMALFCEDIREEKHGVFTLVGLLPDNVNVSAMSGDGTDASGGDAKVLGKLCAFIRINFSPERTPKEIKLRLHFGDGVEHDLGEIERKTIDEAAQKALERNNALAGVISRAVFGGFNFQKAAGQLKIYVIIDDEPHFAAALNINFASDNDGADATSSSNAS
ncbi:MAG: hypothetical protein ABJL17_13620 [Parvibaculum sp.]|uniref:hypothetical protein n=1 Tax=Parvibaculum sp. TaxID=2024848 RepID=UPI0032672A77